MSRADSVDLDLLALWAAAKPLEISQAELHVQVNRLSLVLDGWPNRFDSAGWYRIWIGADALDVTLPDGQPFGLERLMLLGKSGWDAWAERGS